MIFSWFFYSLLLILTTLSAYLYEKSQVGYKRALFFFFSILFPFLVIALRYDVGEDYEAYVIYFNELSQGLDLSYVEPGYKYLNYFLSYFDFNYQSIFVLSGFIFLFFAYKSFPREGFALSTFLFLSVYFFQGGFNQIRQGMAVTIMVYALKYIYSRQFLIYFLFSLLAMSMHFPTGIVLFLVYFFANKSVKKSFFIVTIVLIFILSYLHFFQNVLYQIVHFVIPSKAWYLSSGFGKSTASSFGILTQLLYLSIALITFSSKDIVTSQFGNRANIVINLSFFYFAFYFIHFEINIFSRVQNMFVFYYIFALMYTIKSFEKKSRLIAILLLSIIVIAFYYRFIWNGNNISGHSTHIVPYKTILFDKE